MIKHVNFTGRRRIPRTCIDVVVHEGSPRTFDATLNLKTTRMPPEAKVYLEAMCAGSSVVQRFSFGTVASPKTPSRRQLDEIDGERVFFALKVVDEAQWVGRILGLAEHIQPRQADRSPETGRRGILPIVPKSLGQELWKIEFEEHEVILCVSENVPNIKERIRRDARFRQPYIRRPCASSWQKRWPKAMVMTTRQIGGRAAGCSLREVFTQMGCDHLIKR
jgi:hypothetical protein